MILRTLSCLALAGLTVPLTWSTSRAQDAPPTRGDDATQEDPPEEPEEPVDPRHQAKLEVAAKIFEIADYNGDGWISFREARQSLQLDRTRFHVFDDDGDGRITLKELTSQYLKAIQQTGAFKPPIPNPDDPNARGLNELLVEETAPEETGPTELPPPLPPASNVLDLFGQVVTRGRGANSSPEPDRIVGPVPCFRRVDYDNDGGISRTDLVELNRGSGLEVRINTIVASLDTNGDGSVDEAEFFASMAHDTE
jgi:Ca2+-binding EF-hand superfamily protein